MVSRFIVHASTTSGAKIFWCRVRILPTTRSGCVAFYLEVYRNACNRPAIRKSGPGKSLPRIAHWLVQISTSNRVESTSTQGARKNSFTFFHNFDFRRSKLVLTHHVERVTSVHLLQGSQGQSFDTQPSPYPVCSFDGFCLTSTVCFP
jgi:hypothetical protein